MDVFLVNDDDIEAFAKKLLELMENESLLADFSVNAYKRSKDFLEETVIKQWLDILL